LLSDPFQSAKKEPNNTIVRSVTNGSCPITEVVPGTENDNQNTDSNPSYLDPATDSVSSQGTDNKNRKFIWLKKITFRKEVVESSV